MKKLILSVLVLTGALLKQSEAATYTNYLDYASNAIAQLHAATEEMPKEHALLGKALKTLQKPKVSESVADDYNIFVSVASQLLPLTGRPGTDDVGLGLSNAFGAFVTNAAIEVEMTWMQLAGITDFAKLKRPASNNLWQAQQALMVPTMTTNVQLGILSVRLAYAKLAVAQKLAAKAAASQGFAPNSVEGALLTHAEKNSEGTVTFTDGTNYTSTDEDGPGSGTYTYTRTGLSTGTLVLNESEGGTTTVNLKFSATDAGKFTYHFEDQGGDSGGGSGSFTLTRPE